MIHSLIRLILQAFIETDNILHFVSNLDEEETQSPLNDQDNTVVGKNSCIEASAPTSAENFGQFSKVFKRTLRNFKTNDNEAEIQSPSNDKENTVVWSNISIEASVPTSVENFRDSTVNLHALAEGTTRMYK